MTETTPDQQNLKNGCVGCLALLVLLFAAFAGCSVLFPPKEQTQAQKVDEWYKSASFYGCVRVLKQKLRDPDSYKDDGEYATSGDDGTSKTIAWNFRAKNGFGGYDASSAICKVSKVNGGSVSVSIVE